MRPFIRKDNNIHTKEVPQDVKNSIIMKTIENNKYKKIIIIPNRVVNIVV